MLPARADLHLLCDEVVREMRAASRRGYRAAFGQTRVVTPPRGLNEILVGGDVVRPGGALSVWAAKLDDEEDRIWLKAIKVTELRNPTAD